MMRWFGDYSMFKRDFLNATEKCGKEGEGKRKKIENVACMRPAVISELLVASQG